MKRCPECRRDYYDDSLSYCLDDGIVLLDGPPSMDEPATAIIPAAASPESNTQLFKSQDDKRLAKALSSIRSNRKLVIGGIFCVLLVTALGLGGYWLIGRERSKQIESIAVMPFINDNGNADVEYISDGMTETLIGSLSKLPGLNVKARSTVFRYKGKQTDAKTVGKELGVQALLNGHVFQHGDQLTLSLELIDAASENVIWSDKYERQKTDIASLQSEIARDVSNKLKLKLSGSDRQMLAKRYTDDTEAYQLYLRGRYHANKFTVEDWQQAVDYYKQSIAKDPEFPLPYVGLAEYYQMNSNGTLAPLVAQPNAEAYALKALAIDDDLAEAHSMLGAVRFYRDWNWDAAEREFNRAIELSPNSAEAHYWYAYPAVVSGHFDRGIAEIKRALELDPLNETINADLGWAYYFAGRYDEAIGAYKRTLEIEPDFPMVRMYLGLAYERQGKYKEALAELKTSLARQNLATTLGYLGYTLARSGDSSGAKKAISELERRAELEFVSPYYIAIVYVGLGDKDRAFAYLEKAYDLRADAMVELRSDPLLESLRSDTRFQELAAKVDAQGQSFGSS